ncbi:Glycosyltransferase [Bacteroides ovatus]|uniref:glycosyltransferase n=1 Tax=Bacteroides TaxID=816 RepID=UPI0020A73643|nr:MULTISPECIES: glycosyltransferase [Bacteroides]MCS2336207.1 glycosyltransferase [Bacteroides sp. BFG-606]CAG9889774.1 Glycosyltransferase [Bacteroides ovatus]
MRVIHYIPSLDRTSGGTTAYMQLLTKELGRLVELHVVSHASGNPVKMDNCKVYFIPEISNFMEIKRQWRILLTQLQPDVVHINCCWMPACAFTQKWAQALGYKVVLTPHGMLEPWIMARHYWSKKVPALLLYQKSAVVKADVLHATAKSEKENLQRLGYNDRIKVIANGIDVEDIEMKPSWKRNKEILFLSRIHVKKGINFLLEAVAQLKEQMEGYVIRIAGEGDVTYIEELKQLAARLGISQLIIFEGGVYGNRKWELFRQADLFILPTHSENFGIVVAEALASGTPVITTMGTPWSELESQRCGWWTEVGTEATAQALCNFLSLTEDELEMMGRNGRKLVEEKYSVRKVAKEFVDMYKSIL